MFTLSIPQSDRPQARRAGCYCELIVLGQSGFGHSRPSPGSEAVRLQRQRGSATRRECRHPCAGGAI
jgi:hypothetical protein